jgi:hypothetical protein
MSDTYDAMTDEQLTAEVARRMPTLFAQVSRLWRPDKDANDLESVKRDIERRRWDWSVFTAEQQRRKCCRISKPDYKRGTTYWIHEARHETEPRALMVAYLRARDAEKEASGE